MKANLFLVVLLASSSVSLAQIFSDFETCTLGNLWDQDGWTIHSGSGSPLVLDSPVLAGAKTAYFWATGSITGKRFSASGVTQITDGSILSILVSPETYNTNFTVNIHNDMSSGGAFTARFYQTTSEQPGKVQVYQNIGGIWDFYDTTCPEFTMGDVYKFEIAYNFSGNSADRELTIYGTNITQSGSRTLGGSYTYDIGTTANMLANGGISFSGGNMYVDNIEMLSPEILSLPPANFCDFEGAEYVPDTLLRGIDNWAGNNGRPLVSHLGWGANYVIGETKSGYFYGDPLNGYTGKSFNSEGIIVKNGTVVSLLMRPEVSGSTNAWITYANNAAAGTGLSLRLYDMDNNPRVQCNLTGNWQDVPSPAFTRHETYRIEVEFDYTNKRFKTYCENVSRGSGLIAGGPYSFPLDSAQAVSASGGVLFNGGGFTVDDLRVFSSRTPVDCTDAIALGYKMSGDLDNNCSVDFKDFATFAADWMLCSDPANPLCTQVWGDQ